MKHLISLRPDRHAGVTALRAFTLLELLVVIGIIALLASLAAPAFSDFAEKGREVKCQQNLRDLFVLISTAATDNDGRFPKIEVDPENPIHAGDPEAKPLLETLRRYGATEKGLQCPSDLAGPNWYAKKQTSYMWQPMAEDENKNAINIYIRGTVMPAQLRRVRLLQDWDLVHAPSQTGLRRRMNVVYADGHVSAR
jgi:prepilin-type N-terminal cleavage/methylation domain-containing protein/prepilin-type processing-associated H-X9-DG protein